MACKAVNSVHLLTDRGYPAKAGPSEYFMPAESDRPIRSLSVTAAARLRRHLRYNAVPALNRFNVLVRLELIAHRRFPARRVVLGESIRPFSRATLFDRRRWTRKDGRKRPESQRDGSGLAYPVLPG